MFRAFLCWLAGGHFEVRMVNLKSGKNIPGTRICEGGYWKCRKAFKRKELPYGKILRLQAVAVIDWADYPTSANPAAVKPDMIIVDEAADVPKEVWEGQSPVADPPDDFVQVRVEGDFPPVKEFDIGDSNQRQSEFMAEHQDEPNEYRGEDEDDHLHDNLGPQDWDATLPGYRPTCSICGGFSE